MAFSLLLSGIADAISQVSIPGVTVKDRDELAASWISTPNVLYPLDEGWITNFNLVYQAITRGADAPVNVSYTLNYRFLGTQVGDMGTFTRGYLAAVDKLITIVNALEAVHAPYDGRVDMTITVTDIGPKSDPAGNQYYGADLALIITELQN